MTRPQRLQALFLAALAVVSVVAVDPGDVVVVYRLGAVHRVLEPGLSLRAPWPIEVAEVVHVSEVRRVTPGKQRMLTGDTNLVDLDLVIQYTVSDPVAFQLALQDPEPIMTALVSSMAAEIVATVDVDTLLTTGRVDMQTQIVGAAQAALDNLHAGIRIGAVEVRELSPPPAVVDAFNDVSSARGDRETLALTAEAFASEHIPEVRGEARAHVEQARAKGAQRTARAAADVERFETLAEVESKSPKSTRLQAWNETLLRIGKRVEVHALRGQTEIRLDGLD